LKINLSVNNFFEYSGKIKRTLRQLGRPSGEGEEDEEFSPSLHLEEEGAPTVKSKEECAPTVESKEECAPSVEPKEEFAPTVESKEE
jgi:hypothetical protein